MEDFKREFIDFLIKSGALKIGEDYTLKSKRISPFFVNVGDFSDGNSISSLGEFYAKSILNSGLSIPECILYGIPEKGVSLVSATAIGLAREGTNIPLFFTRKFPKEHGEFTNISQEERAKKLIVLRVPKPGQPIIQLDDVFTTGDAKYEARKLLNSLGDFDFPLLAIAVDRQEVGIDGKSAIEEYEGKLGTRVVSIVNASEIYSFLRQNVPIQTPNGEIRSEHVDRFLNYLRVYGTNSARQSLERLEQRIINRDKSVVPACDVSTLEEFDELVRQTADVEGIGGYKVGFELGLGYGLGKVVATARKHTDRPVIYDHQKAGTDIPDTGKNFARVCKNAGVDAVILFPQAGPETERAWIYHSLDKELKVIVGGRMTHPAYAVSEGGFITDEGALEMYKIAARAGVNNFVVPGNKPEVIQQVREVIEAEGVNPVFYAPGFIAQGGSISDAATVAGERFHGIVGRGIYQPQNMSIREAALEHTSQL